MRTISAFLAGPKIAPIIRGLAPVVRGLVPWRPPLIVLWLGWKIVLPLCGLAAIVENFRQLIRHEFTVWLAFLPLFLLLNLLLLISAVWLARRRFANRKTRLIAAVLCSALALLCAAIIWPVINWLLDWKIPAWFALLCAGALELIGLLILSSLPPNYGGLRQEAVPQTAGASPQTAGTSPQTAGASPRTTGASIALCAALLALTAAGILTILPRARQVPLSVVRPADPRGYWAQPLRNLKSRYARLTRTDYYYGRSYFDVYTFPVQAGQICRLGADSLYPLYLRMEVSLPGGPALDRTQPGIEIIDEILFTAAADGRAWASVYGLADGDRNEGLGYYQLMLECPPLGWQPPVGGG